MTPGLLIVSYEHISEDYLRLIIQKGGQSCGSIDFIGDKVNFNISGKSEFFKGAERIAHIAFSFIADDVVFLFSNKQKLVIYCYPEALQEINLHVKRHRQSGKSRKDRNRFFDDPGE